MNLHYYLNKSVSEVLLANLGFWTSLHRPLGGAVYLGLYKLFGLTPQPYYFLAFLLFAANLFLLLTFFLRLTNRVYFSLLATAFASIHIYISPIWFNFGAVYELLAFGFTLATLHLYLSSQDNKKFAKRYYILALMTFILALNAKEMAITVPAILTAYAIIFRVRIRPTRITDLAKRLVPFYGIAAVYALGKLTGREAYWKENPTAYTYFFDRRIYDNLGQYLSDIFFHRVTLQGAAIFLVLVITLALCFALKNRLMLFGWIFFVVSLIPVLGLPRVWGLYLYIPLIGFSLYSMAFISEIGARFLDTFLKPAFASKQVRFSPALASILLLFIAFILQFGTFQQFSNRKFLQPAHERENFCKQLLTAHPQFPPTATLIFENAPLRKFDLNNFVWLKYKSSEIRVLESSKGKASCNQGDEGHSDCHAFRYTDGVLTELGL